jgi:hypothetical protein
MSFGVAPAPLPVASWRPRSDTLTIERIFRFAQTDRCECLARDLGIEVFDAVLDDKRLPEKFRAIRLPQMRAGIRRLRERQRAARPT